MNFKMSIESFLYKKIQKQNMANKIFLICIVPFTVKLSNFMRIKSKSNRIEPNRIEPNRNESNRIEN